MRHHHEIEIEMRQMKALAEELYQRYWALREEYDEAWREAVGSDYVDVQEKMAHVEAMGGRVFRT
tara:strand:- start:141 stop:335 length:195 start_codon:yes stop_codon:yes gene_type:complete